MSSGPDTIERLRDALRLSPENVAAVQYLQLRTGQTQEIDHLGCCGDGAGRGGASVPLLVIPMLPEKLVLLISRPTLASIKLFPFVALGTQLAVNVLVMVQPSR